MRAAGEQPGALPDPGRAGSLDDLVTQLRRLNLDLVLGVVEALTCADSTPTRRNLGHAASRSSVRRVAGSARSARADSSRLASKSTASVKSVSSSTPATPWRTRSRSADGMLASSPSTTGRISVVAGRLRHLRQ